MILGWRRKRVMIPACVCMCAWALARPSLPADDAPELTIDASRAIDRGLQFLLEHQNADGSWGQERPTAITSLVLMAFMARGEFPGYGRNGVALDRAKDWLLGVAQQAPDGYLGTSMYEHAFATLTFTELLGMTANPEDYDAILQAVKAAIECILQAQGDAGGWRYSPIPGGADTSVTTSIFVALAAGRQAGIAVPKETIAKVLAYLEAVVNPELEEGGFFYVPVGAGEPPQLLIPSSAGGAYIAQLAGARETDMVERALRYLEYEAPQVFKPTQRHSNYYYGHYYAIQAMVQAGDERYARWYPQIRDALIALQHKDGGWTEREDERGKVTHETPMAVIILATPHRYIPIYQR